MKTFTIAEGRLVESADALGDVVLATAPTDQERARLQQEFRIDDYDMASTLDPDEVARLDSSDGRMLLIWKVPDSTTASEKLELHVSVVGVIMALRRLAFVRATGDMSFADREFRQVSDPRDVFLAFLLRTVRHFVAHLKVIRQIGSELERKITISMENRHLLQMFSLSESLVYYLDAIEGNASVLSKLRNLGPQLGFDQRQIELLDDIILENAQAARQAGIFSSVLSGLMDARGTVVNNNMGVLLKNLTLINIVFLPLNLIASIGGMSEWSMMTSHLGWPISYAIFSVAMVMIGWGTWMLMKKIVDRGSAH